MSVHSYSRVWLHLVWGTLERSPVFMSETVETVFRVFAASTGLKPGVNEKTGKHIDLQTD
jgi:hypothetical protein